jgi:hypothetical protein
MCLTATARSAAAPQNRRSRVRPNDLVRVEGNSPRATAAAGRKRRPPSTTSSGPGCGTPCAIAARWHPQRGRRCLPRWSTGCCGPGRIIRPPPPREAVPRDPEMEERPRRYGSRLKASAQASDHRNDQNLDPKRLVDGDNLRVGCASAVSGGRGTLVQARALLSERSAATKPWCRRRHRGDQDARG